MPLANLSLRTRSIETAWGPFDEADASNPNRTSRLSTQSEFPEIPLPLFSHITTNFDCVSSSQPILTTLLHHSRRDIDYLDTLLQNVSVHYSISESPSQRHTPTPQALQAKGRIGNGHRRPGRKHMAPAAGRTPVGFNNGLSDIRIEHRCRKDGFQHHTLQMHL